MRAPPRTFAHEKPLFQQTTSIFGALNQLGENSSIAELEHETEEKLQAQLTQIKADEKAFKRTKKRGIQIDLASTGFGDYRVQSKIPEIKKASYQRHQEYLARENAKLRETQAAPNMAVSESEDNYVPLAIGGWYVNTN